MLNPTKEIPFLRPDASLSGELKELEEKIKLVCDIDEVLADSWSAHLEHLNSYFGRNFTPDEVAPFGFVQNFPGWEDKEELQRITKILRQDPEFILSHQVIEGALKGIWNLTKIGQLLAYITTRPASTSQATLKWLETNGFPKAPVVCLPDEYLLTLFEWEWKRRKIEEIRPDLVIEDNIPLAEELTVATIIIEGRHNRHVVVKGSHIIKVASWQEVPPKAILLKETILKKPSLVKSLSGR
jgi:5'(3')-deoxyribonucleotidase